MAIAVIRGAAEAMGVPIPVKKVTASRGKRVRAEPVAAMASRGRVHHVGNFPDLEEEMCIWTEDAGYSPDRMDACLVEDTPVLTYRGSVPIKSVTADDAVLTRLGWKSVLWSGIVQESAEVISVETENGVLTGTPDHVVWTPEGWRRLDSLICGDTLLRCHGVKASISKVSDSFGILCPNLDQRESTTLPTTTKPERERLDSNNYMWSSGEPHTTGCQCQKGISFITSTSTLSITTRVISSAVLQKSMPNIIEGNLIEKARNGLRISREYARFLLNGTEAQKGWSGTASTGRRPGSVGSTPQEDVMRARRSTELRMKTGGLATVRLPVLDESLTVSTDMINWCPVRCVELSSGRINTIQYPQLVLDRVVRISDIAERRPVYDLTVADQHEFFADGLLVHNCVWPFFAMKMVGNNVGSVGSFPSQMGSLRLVK